MLVGIVGYVLVCGVFMLLVQAGQVGKHRPWEEHPPEGE